jgi:hypothetical protein
MSRGVLDVNRTTKKTDTASSAQTIRIALALCVSRSMFYSFVFFFFFSCVFLCDLLSFFVSLTFLQI